MNEIEFKILLNEKICDLADAILRYHDPCKLRGNSCLLADDIEKSTLHCCYRGKYDISDIDKHCRFWRDGRCGFRYAGCKLFLCATAIRENPDCVEDLKDLERIAKRYDLVRRPYLGDRYAGRTEELAMTGGDHG